MRRFLTPPLALIAGLALVLTGCAGETPTTPTGSGNGGGNGGGGTCNVVISLAASSLSPLAGSATLIRATATKAGTPIPDGSSILFTTDYGFFLETGLPSVSKIVISGVADVTLASDLSGRANVKATLECGSALIAIQFGAIPANGPFISSISPNTGTCAGGDTITINGGRFGTSATRITFGGIPATIVSVADTVIVVKTPARTLANPQVPEAVDVTVVVASGSVTFVKGFTYFCVDKRIFISSVIPNSGPPDGGTAVTINGGNFGGILGPNVATTRVTFGGVAATVTSVSVSAINVLTPRHVLANPAVSETVDVAVTIELGLVSQQSAVLTQAYTYRASGTGGPGTCANPNSNPALYISRITPNTGSPDGGLAPGNTPFNIEGGGFGTNIATVRVDFGGLPAQVLSVSDNLITVSIPRRTLANPDVPESVDVVVTIDVGGPNQSCTISKNGFTYTRLALEPVIFSTSPRTGPNDASTRVTIFGSGFQFPEQVFLSGGSCGGRVEATVVSIKSEEIVFLTPIASNGNDCLRNALATIEVLNPQTGKTAKCTACFKYYSCPSVFGTSPASIPYNQVTTLSINGSNFEEPVEATLSYPGCPANLSTKIQVTSVSSSIITVQVPAVDPLTCGVCGNIAANISLTFQSTTCAAVSTSFTYRVDPVTVSSVGPQQVDQDGSAFDIPFTPGPAQTITVTGGGFLDPMTAVLLKAGNPLGYTVTNNTNVANPASLTFPAPAIKDSDMNSQACIPLGGTTLIGLRYVPTSFGVRVTNARTGCSGDLQNALIYNPQNTSCRLAPAITGPAAFPSPATICVPYGPTPAITVLGGTGGNTFSATGLPAGLTINSATGVISGTPVLVIAGPGTALTPLTIVVTVTDSSLQTASRTYSVDLTDPGAPLSVAGNAAQTIPNASNGTAITATGGAGTINWTSVVATSPLPGSITVIPTTGPSTSIRVAGGVPAGSYVVTVTATDSLVCSPKHVVSLPVTVTVP